MANASAGDNMVVGNGIKPPRCKYEKWQGAGVIDQEAVYDSLDYAIETILTAVSVTAQPEAILKTVLQTLKDEGTTIIESRQVKQ